MPKLPSFPFLFSVVQGMAQNTLGNRRHLQESCEREQNDQGTQTWWDLYGLIAIRPQ